MNIKKAATIVPEARYAYYRRCQVFRRNGEQCKAPAEKGERICHAHAAQQATALRRERERQAVLAEAVAEMRRRGKTEFEAKDLFMSFNGIQVTIAKMAQALIDGRIDCKTAGRLAVDLQTMSKLLWIYHRGTQRGKTLPRINTDNTDLKTLPNAELEQCGNASLKRAQAFEIRCVHSEKALITKATNEHKGIHLCESQLVDTKVLMFSASSRSNAGGRYWTGQRTRAA